MLLMNELESWLDVLGYEGLYQVSNFGRVRSLDHTVFVRQDRYKEPRITKRKGRVLKEYKRSGSQRRMVILSLMGIRQTFSVHRLVAVAFLPNPNKHPVVNHINHNHLDNRASNLEWCTYSHNTKHAIAAGRMDHVYKQNPKLTKLTKAQAIEAKRLLALGLGNSKVANQIGIGYNAVYHIAAGHTWKHI